MMMERLTFLWPEISLFTATCIVMVMGLSRAASVRSLCAPVAGLSLIAAGVLAALTTPDASRLAPEGGQQLLPGLAQYFKVVACGVGLLLLLVLAGTVDRREEGEIAAGRRRFDPLRTNRAEFYAFFLFSMTGLLLCGSADNLIWLFLALELTSLPTYIMVTLSTDTNKSREAGVKYFFLGALGAAVFLFGFALLYGATGTTNFNEIHAAFERGGISAIGMAGLLVSVLGVCFKVAAVPMHFYTPDVYEGAAAPVSAFLAFVPKAAGFASILFLCSLAGWQYGPDASSPEMAGGGASLPEGLRITLWVIAALTMTVGNVLALLQSSIKRILAYSSIAHSGYMLVGVIAGPGTGNMATSGVAAVLFYLAAYGVMNLGAFAVVASLEKPGADGEMHEADHVDDLRGMWRNRPGMASIMVLSGLGLLGFPPLLGFLGKVPLFTSGISAGEIPLVVILGLNSAVGAVYYLRLVAAPFLSAAEEAPRELRTTPYFSRIVAGAISAAGVVLLAVWGNTLMERAAGAGRVGPAEAPLGMKAEAEARN